MPPSGTPRKKSRKGLLIAGVVALVVVVAGGIGTAVALTGGGDERDNSVLTRSLAIGGLLALPLTGGAAVVLAAGVSVSATMAILLWTQLLVVVVAFTVINRRT